MFRYETNGRAVKQTMARTFLPAAIEAGARVVADCRVAKLVRRNGRVIGARVRAPARARRNPRTASWSRAEHVFVCAGASQTPALLQRSGIRRNIGNGLKMHPTVKIAARFPHPIDHGDVPMHRVTEFAPGLTIGGSASRRGHVALALADSSAPTTPTRSPTGSTSPSTTPRFAARAPAACSRCPVSARRSSRTT